MGKILKLFSLFGVIFFYSLFAAISFIVLQDGYGKGDLFSFMFWTLLFSAFIVLFEPVFRKISFKFPLNFQPFFYVIINSGAALFFGYSVFIFLGFWFRLFSFPVVICWIVAAFLASLSKVLREKWPNYKYYIRAGTILGVFLTAFCFSKYLDHSSNVEGVSLELYLWDSKSKLDDKFFERAGLKGKFKEAGGGKNADNPSKTIFIAVKEMPSKEIFLKLPKEGEIIYYQVSKNSFDYWPKNIDLTEDKVQVIPDIIDPKTDKNYKNPDTLDFYIESMGFTMRFPEHTKSKAGRR